MVLPLLLACIAVPDSPLELARGPHVLLDDYLWAEARGAARVVTPPRRALTRPVVTGPEDRCFQPYVTVLRDAGSGRFRVWYGVPENASQSHLGYMESPDGIRWERPHRVLADPGRIQFGVSILDDGARASDPAQRYKFAWWNDGGLNVASSPDGLTWTRLGAGVVLAHNHDINNVFRDPIRGRYMANVSSYITGPTWQGTRRVTMQSASPDLLRWEPPWYAITPDARDEGETQFYCMGGVIARGGLLIGMVRVLRDDLPADPGGPVAGIGWTCLAWSRDGRTWTRDRTPYLDRDPAPGTWDHAMAWIDCQLPVGDEVYLYYGGYARGHKVERFTERQIGLARIPRDRYAAWEAREPAGLITTKPLVARGSRLTLNVEAPDGQVRVQVEDESGRPLRGRAFADCVPVRGDVLDAPVRWRTTGALPRGRAVRLSFRLQRARLYAIGVE